MAQVSGEWVINNQSLTILRNIFATIIGEERERPKAQHHNFVVEGIQFAEGWNMNHLAK
jgi:hypothetical protein